MWIENLPLACIIQKTSGGCFCITLIRRNAVLLVRDLDRTLKALQQRLWNDVEAWNEKPKTKTTLCDCSTTLERTTRKEEEHVQVGQS
jgi:hypothetical protein